MENTITLSDGDHLETICAQCGRHNMDDALFCEGCGEELAMIKSAFPGGHYVATDLIETGTQFTLYKAVDTRTNEKVIVKVIDLPFTAPEELQAARELFMKEMASLLAFKHKAIPRLLDFFTVESDDSNKSTFFQVMSCPEGTLLASNINERKGRLFDGEEVVSIMEQILDVLQYLHSMPEPCMCGSITPSKVIISNDRVSLTWVGKTGALSENAHEITAYTAPECFRGICDRRSDIYSLGVLMHFLLTGQDPEETDTPFFSFRPPHEINPEVPRYLSDIVMAMLDLVFFNRPDSADKLSKQLKGVAKMKDAADSDERKEIRVFFQEVKTCLTDIFSGTIIGNKLGFSSRQL